MLGAILNGFGGAVSERFDVDVGVTAGQVTTSFGTSGMGEMSIEATEIVLLGGSVTGTIRFSSRSNGDPAGNAAVHFGDRHLGLSFSNEGVGLNLGMQFPPSPTIPSVSAGPNTSMIGSGGGAPGGLRCVGAGLPPTACR